MLGASRTARLTAKVRTGPLPSRSPQLAAIAALIVGARMLGDTWWARPTLASFDDDDEPDGPTPDEILVTGVPTGRFTSRTVVEDLALLSAEATAEPWVDVIDLTWPVYVDAATILHGAAVGDRLVASYEVGASIDAVVTMHPDGALGTQIDLASARYCPPAQVESTVRLILGQGRILLPGEKPGTRSDRLRPRSGCQTPTASSWKEPSRLAASLRA